MKDSIKNRYGIYKVYILEDKIYGAFAAEIADSYESALLNCLKPKTIPDSILSQPIKIKKIKRIGNFIYFSCETEDNEPHPNYAKNFAVEKL